MLDKIDMRAREAIRIVLVDPDRQLRAAIRQSLMYAGFKSIADHGALEPFREGLETGIPDLLLIDANMPDGDACELVRSMRYGRFGSNPFLSVIMTVYQDQTTDLGRIINSGVDHVIVKPVSPKMIFERMEALIERRKPFIAVSTYIGPDRRKQPRDEDEIPTFEVPNTLRARAKGEQIDPMALQDEIDRSLGKINGEMVSRQAFHLNFLAQRAVPLLEEGEKEAGGILKDMKRATYEIMRRIDAKALAHVVELCSSLNTIIESLGATLGMPASPRDLALLRKTAQAIYVGWNTDSDTIELSMKVAQAVDKFEKKKAPGKMG